MYGWKVQHTSSIPVEKDKLPHTHSASAPLRVFQGWCTSSRVFFSDSVKLTAALPAEWNDIVRSLSLHHSLALSLSLFFYLLLPLLLFARSLAVQTAQLSSVLPLPQQLLHEPCVSECAVTFKGERNLQGQCAPHPHPPYTPTMMTPPPPSSPAAAGQDIPKKKERGVCSGWGGG